MQLPVMAPTPTPPRQEEPIPQLHLQCLDLSESGSERFFSHTSSPHSILRDSSKTVLSALYPSDLYLLPQDVDPSSPSTASTSQLSPPVRSVTLHLRSFQGVAHTTGSQLDNDHKEVHFSTNYISSISGDSKRIKQEIEGVVVHELVHVYQWNGKGTAPGGLIEGIADWVRLGAELGPPHWKKGRGGERWDQGYEATAFFLEFLSTHFKDPLFVPKLNLAFRHQKWDDGAPMKKLMGGKSVEEMFKVYKDSLEDKSTAPPALPTHTKPPPSAGGGGYNVAYSS